MSALEEDEETETTGDQVLEFNTASEQEALSRQKASLSPKPNKRNRQMLKRPRPPPKNSVDAGGAKKRRKAAGVQDLMSKNGKKCAGEADKAAAAGGYVSDLEDDIMHDEDSDIEPQNNSPFNQQSNGYQDEHGVSDLED
jgi:hypothetical protein